LQSQVERAAKELGVQVTFVVEPGDVTRTVTSIAKELNADLVVVGRSAKPLHQIAGSLSHRLTSRHDAPVVVVVP
jgi:nucleotide-binding universal stress UspA family protein